MIQDFGEQTGRTVNPRRLRRRELRECHPRLHPSKMQHIHTIFGCQRANTSTLDPPLVSGECGSFVVLIRLVWRVIRTVDIVNGRRFFPPYNPILQIFSYLVNPQWVMVEIGREFACRMAKFIIRTHIFRTVGRGVW